MGPVVADTHAIVWYLLASEKISAKAMAALDEANAAGDPIFIASISAVEVVYLIEKGRLPEVTLERLINTITEPDSGFTVVPLDLGIVQAIRKIPRDVVPDIADRIIAATAFHLNLPLVTRDRRIQKTGIITIW
jgi:PIN domain nuclease of toxin-antitoxin system